MNFRHVFLTLFVFIAVLLYFGKLFGSFARREETPKSDLDLLVKYDRTQKVSLFDISHYMLDLEGIIGREVDLIEYRSLKPFAVPSAERDKYLIYER